MSQPYCPACLCIVAEEDTECSLCEHTIPSDGWLQTTTFRYPWLGYLIDQRYRLVQYLGYGGMGDVYRAESQSVGVSFAAKVIDRRIVPSIQTLEDLAQRLDREVAAMAMLSSPHVTRVIDYFIMPEEIFALLIEFAPGQTLDRVIHDAGALEPALALEMARQVLEALAELNNLELVHRDLKPENLMIQIMPSGRPFVRLLDFGIVKTLDHTRITEGFLGTPHFAAPEQALDSGSVDGRSDLYSLGCIMYYILTGSVPFPGESSVAVLNSHLHAPVPTLADAVPGVDPDLSALVARLMAKDPAERPATAEELLDLPVFAGTAGRFEVYPEVGRSQPRLTEERVSFFGTEPRAFPIAQVAKPHVSPVVFSALSPAMDRAVVVTAQYEMTSWSLVGEPKPISIKLEPSEVTRWVFFSASGGRLLVVTKEGHVHVHDPATLERTAEFSLLPSNYRWVGPSRVDDDRLLAATPGSVFCWDINAGLRHLIEGAFILDVTLVRALGRYQTLFIEKGTGRRLTLKENPNDSNTFDVSWLRAHGALVGAKPLDLASFGQMILVKSQQLLEANHHHDRVAPITTELHPWVSATILSDGNPLCLTTDGDLYLVSMDEEAVRLATGVAELKASPDRSVAVSFGSDGVAYFWKVGQKRPVQEFQFAETPSMPSLLWDLSPNLDRLAFVDTSGDRSRMVIQDLNGTAEDDRALELPAPIASMRWSDEPGAAFALTAHLEALLIDLQTGACVEIPTSVSEPVSGCVAGGGRVVCVANRDGLLEAVNATNGEMTWRFQSLSPVTVLASARKGTRLAVGCLDGSICILDSSTGAEVQRIPATTPVAVEYLRFSADGALLGAYQVDGKAQLHKTENGTLAYSQRLENVTSIANLAVGPEGQLIAFRQAGLQVIRFDVTNPDAEEYLELRYNGGS